MSRKTVVAALVLASSLALAASGKRIHLVPKYSPGATLRYRIESTTATTGKTTTPVLNPEGATKSTLTIHLVLRLDVLNAPATAAGATRLRATYEKSSAQSQSDAFDPAQPSASDQYARLEGRSLEFSIAPSGQLADVKGLDDNAVDRSVAQSALSWLAGISTVRGFPAAGIAIGEKWKSERPVEGAPVAGLAWRVESTYLRDEPCDRSSIGAATPGAAAPVDPCAVILSQFEIARSGSPHSDATPEDYLRNGLRVSGSWTGSGQSLNYISFSSGFLVRSTETTDQRMDYKIISASTGSSIARNAQVHSESEISLDSAPAVSPAK